jgi:hypothetical protein
MAETAGWASYELDAGTTAELVLDIWRIDRRAQRHSETPESVRVACELTMDRLRALGFELREPIGERYDENMRVRVVDSEDADEDLHVSECLAPAVYYRSELVRPAEVVLRGRREDGATDR